MVPKVSQLSLLDESQTLIILYYKQDQSDTRSFIWKHLGYFLKLLELFTRQRMRITWFIIKNFSQDFAAIRISCFHDPRFSNYCSKIFVIASLCIQKGICKRKSCNSRVSEGLFDTHPICEKNVMKILKELRIRSSCSSLTFIQNAKCSNRTYFLDRRKRG